MTIEFRTGDYQVLEDLGWSAEQLEGLAEGLQALWAVRVLDAAAEAYDEAFIPYAGEPSKGGRHWFFLYHGQKLGGVGLDAARLAAAEAVYPTLPADVQAKLGVRP